MKNFTSKLILKFLIRYKFKLKFFFQNKLEIKLKFGAGGGI